MNPRSLFQHVQAQGLSFVLGALALAKALRAYVKLPCCRAASIAPRASNSTEETQEALAWLAVLEMQILKSQWVLAPGQINQKPALNLGSQDLQSYLL